MSTNDDPAAKAEENFTPGPWRVDVIDPMIVSTDGGPITRKFIARCWEQVEAGISVTDANARLIAAAPDLYEACVACLEDFESGMSGGRRMRRETIIEMLRAALAKAVSHV